jgi:hypothetical protein
MAAITRRGHRRRADSESVRYYWLVGVVVFDASIDITPCVSGPESSAAGYLISTVNRK